MLENIQRPLFGHCYTDNASSWVCTIGYQCSEILLPLVSPEDTTPQAGERRNPPVFVERPSVRGVVKTVMWLAVAVGLALLIGQLN